MIPDHSFETATGSIDYPFTNDYMFRAILQKDKQVLKALASALLHLDKDSVKEVSSKFSIHVLDLTKIDLASEEDKKYGIDRWARLFMAKTWEELRMVAKNNPDLLQASNELYTINKDDLIRQQARARADAEFWERNRNARIKKLEEALIEKDSMIAAKDNFIAEKDSEIHKLKEELAKLKQNSR